MEKSQRLSEKKHRNAIIMRLHGGRPPKISPAIQTKILAAIRAGNYLETASAYAGISKSSLYAWLKAGARSESGPYHEFSDAVQKALAEAEVNDVALIAKAATRNWQAAAWRLERKFPGRWGRAERPPEDPLPDAESEHQLDYDRLSYQELETLARLFGIAAGEEVSKLAPIDALPTSEGSES